MTETEDTPEIERNFGVQPLDALLLSFGLDNHALVEACAEPITHKAVQRARKGRRLTVHMQRRVAAALNKALSKAETPPEREYGVKDLFTY